MFKFSFRQVLRNYILVINGNYITIITDPIQRFYCLVNSKIFCILMRKRSNWLPKRLNLYHLLLYYNTKRLVEGKELIRRTLKNMQ